MKLSVLFGVLLFIVFSFNVSANKTVSAISFPLESLVAERLFNGKLTRLLLPVPKGAIANDAVIKFYANNQSINAKLSIVNTWPSILSSNKKFIRVLLIEIEQSPILIKALTLRWNNFQKNQLVNKAFLPNSDVQLVYPTQSWLAQALLLHPEYNQDENAWYIEPQKKYAKYFANPTLLTQHGYPPEKAAQWLYDRPQAIYQLFIMSGESQWLNKANDLSDFYQQHIDKEGQFILKKRFDVKYLMPRGLLYDYLLNGNYQAKNALEKIFQASLTWDEEYSISRGFWTERNQAAALNTAISYWEISNDEQALKRIYSIIEATVAMTFNPENDWSLRGCPQHSFKSHEGWGDESPACSPWMMALLGDALWRFYRLTDDKKAAALIDAFGDFVLNHGLFYGDKRVNNIVIPKYIVSIENPEQEELNQWTDPQHACDVAGLLGKSTYIKEASGRDGFMVKTLFSALLEQCQKTYIRLKKEQSKKNKKSNKNYWLLKPARRFGWMYSTTSELPWLESSLLNNY